MAEERTDPLSIIGSAAERTVTFERAAVKVDEEARTVELCFSTENPVERWFGYEILDHSPGAGDFKRLNKGGPVLLCHDRHQQVGAVVKGTARIDEDRKGRATVKFSRSQPGTDTMGDVQDEIRTTVSVRYIVRKMVLEKSDKEKGDTYRVTKWEALEISFEPIEADTQCGVGRAADAAEAEEVRRRAAALGMKVVEDAPAPDHDSPDAARAGQTTEEVRTEMETENARTPAPAASEVVARAREVIEMGEVLREADLAAQMAAEGKGVEEFRAAVLEKRRAAQAAAQPAAEEPTAAAARQGGAQLARSSNRVQLVAFRGEGAQERALRAGHFLRAALFGNDQSREFCREHGIPLQRAQSESDGESGGVLVYTELENTLIDLRLEYGVFRRNANVTPMKSSRKEKPRRKGGLKAYPIGARGANRRLTESKKGWDLVGLDAKKWGVLAKYEDELSEDAIISMADDLTSEGAYAFTEVEDECGFYGDGTSDYHGIVGLVPRLRNPHNAAAAPAVANVAGLVEASGNLWSEVELLDILALVGRLPSFARKSGMVKWYCSNEFWATVLCRIALSLGGSAVAQIQDELKPVFLGKPVEIVEVMPHVEENSQIPLLYGNLAQAAMFGDRRGVTVKMTDSNDTDFEEDLMAVKFTERFDINVHDVGNADASAAKRLAGPVVGLITKAA